MTSSVINFGISTFNTDKASTAAQMRLLGAMVGPQAGWACFQEVEQGAQSAALDTVMPPAKWYHQHAGSENEIFVKKSRWGLAAQSEMPKGILADIKVDLSPGLAGVSPNRNLTADAIKFLENLDFTITMLADFHFVSGVHPSNDHYQWRLDTRKKDFDLTSAQVGIWNDAGLNVCIMGDSNWGDMPKFHPDQQWLLHDVNNDPATHGDDRIDTIAWIPAKTSNFELLALSTERYTNPVRKDHDLRVVNVSARALTPPPPPPPPTLLEQVDAWGQKYYAGQAWAQPRLQELHDIVAKGQ